MKNIKILKSLIEKTLAQPPLQGKNALEPFRSFAEINVLPFLIIEDTDVSNKPEVHKITADLCYCLEGELIFVCGGKISGAQFNKNIQGEPDPNEISGKKIIGGKSIVLKAGDWLWISAGQPHMHKCKSTARLIIIKIRQS